MAASEAGLTSYYRAMHSFDKDESEPGEMSIIQGEVLKRSPEEGEAEGSEERDGWMLVQSLRTGEIGYVPAVSMVIRTIQFVFFSSEHS